MVLRLTHEQRHQLFAKEASIKFVPPGHKLAPIVPKQPAPGKAPAPLADEVRMRLPETLSEDAAVGFLRRSFATTE